MQENVRILVADDDADYVKMFTRFLSSLGYVCESASDGDIAAEKLATGDYNLLISDIEMPGNKDLSLIRRAAEIAPGLPVILVTGYPSVTTAIESHNLSVFAYLVKPPNFAELTAQVKKAVARHRVFLAVNATEARMAGWMNDLAALRESVQSYSAGPQNSHLRGYVSLTFNSLIGAMSELRNLLDFSYLDDHSTETCHLENCPVKQRFEALMEDAVAALKDTKGSFKSKEIAELRKRFEHLLEAERRPAAPRVEG
jgi:CheY-like chemotaxis protein